MRVRAPLTLLLPLGETSRISLIKGEYCRLTVLNRSDIMPRSKPLLFEVRPSSYEKNGCQWFITGYPEGKRKKFWFKTEKAAKASANERNAEITATGTQDQLPYTLRITALEGAKQLEPFGKSLPAG